MEKETKSTLFEVLGASEVSANLYCNSRTSVFGRLRDYLRLLMTRSVLTLYEWSRVRAFHLDNLFSNSLGLIDMFIAYIILLLC